VRLEDVVRWLPKMKSAVRALRASSPYHPQHWPLFTLLAPLLRVLSVNVSALAPADAAHAPAKLLIDGLLADDEFDKSEDRPTEGYSYRDWLTLSALIVGIALCFV
jgi:hypothetical protein